MTIELHAGYVAALKYGVEFFLICFLNMSFMHLIGKLLNLVTVVLLFLLLMDNLSLKKSDMSLCYPESYYPRIHAGL